MLTSRPSDFKTLTIKPWSLNSSEQSKSRSISLGCRDQFLETVET